MAFCYGSFSGSLPHKSLPISSYFSIVFPLFTFVSLTSSDFIVLWPVIPRAGLIAAPLKNSHPPGKNKGEVGYRRGGQQGFPRGARCPANRSAREAVAWRGAHDIWQALTATATQLCCSLALSGFTFLVRIQYERWMATIKPLRRVSLLDVPVWLYISYEIQKSATWPAPEREQFQLFFPQSG